MINTEEALRNALERLYDATKNILAGKPVRDVPEMFAEVDAALRQPPNGYATAFYEIAAMLGIGARADTPANVWTNEMRPKLEALLASPKSETDGEVERVEITQEDRDAANRWLTEEDDQPAPSLGNMLSLAVAFSRHRIAALRRSPAPVGEIPACRECGQPSPNGDPCTDCAEVERILAMSDEEVLASSSPEDLAHAAGFKEGLQVGLRAISAAPVGRKVPCLCMKVDGDVICHNPACPACAPAAPVGVDAMREALTEARLQLEYLDSRFPTGTTPAVVARIDAALAPTSPQAQQESGDTITVTDTMREAGRDAIVRSAAHSSYADLAEDAYRAMIAASPSSPLNKKGDDNGR